MRSVARQDLTGLAVDLGGTKIAAARIHRGRIQQTVTRSTTGAGDPSCLIAELSEAMGPLAQVEGEPVGVAVAGRLDAQGRWSAVNRSILSNLHDEPLEQQLETQLGTRVTALNDTRAAVIGEYRYGAGAGANAVAYLTVSTGISAGVVVNGTALGSANGMLGHVGFLPSRYGGGRCGSGRLDTYETVASGRGIEARARDYGPQNETCKGVFRRAAAGEVWANDLIQTSAAAIAELSASLVAIYGVERIVIGGGVGLAEGYLARVKDSLRHEPEQFRPKLVPAGLGKHSGVFGALSAAIERGAPR